LDSAINDTIAAVSAFNLNGENVVPEKDRIFDRMESVPVATLHAASNVYLSFF
jgi:hypothetical protein